jgi:hypothetical protein
MLAMIPLVALVMGGGDAAAYPQFQLSTGAARCAECHVESSGGGLLNDYGRDEAGETLSGRGDGRLLHGAWAPPSWLTLGGDVRGALGGKQLDDEPPTVLAFPMQADLTARFAVGPLALTVTGGLNGAARARPAGATALNYLVSRQHFFTYTREAENLTIRAGRFFPTLGLRTQDHTAYVRRYLDHYLLEEPYALEVNRAQGEWDLFASAFVPNPVPGTGAGPRGYGVTGYAERLLAGGETAVAGQIRAALTEIDRRVLVGVVGKHWFACRQLLVLAELDLQRQRIPDGQFTRYQFVGYLGVTRMMLPGYLFGVALQRFAPDVSFRGTARNAVELNAQAFPWAHVELHLLGRIEASDQATTHPNLLALLQLHYYL